LDQPGGEDHLLQAMALARSEGDLNTELLAAGNLISYHESSGSPTRGRALTTQVIARAREAGLGMWERSFRVPLAGLDFHAGNYEAVLKTAEELLAQPLEERARRWLLEQYCLTLIDLGRIDEAVRRMTTAADDIGPEFRTTPTFMWVLVEAALWGGQPLRALTLLEGFFDGSDADPNLVLGLVSRSWARFDAGRDPGPPAGDQVRPMLQAVVPETAAVRLLYEGEPLSAAGDFDRAAELWAPYHLRGELRCRWAAAEAVRRSGDIDAAVVRLEAVETRAAERGMEPLLGRVHRSLRAAGRRRSAPRSRNGADALSARERTVLSLVGSGLTNAEIAGRLGLSRHTVVSQLSSASAKLGATSRAQAASMSAALPAEGS
jgi:DNA-binding CsgD family transcriptional regulator